MQILIALSNSTLCLLLCLGFLFVCLMSCCCYHGWRLYLSLCWSLSSHLLSYSITRSLSFHHSRITSFSLCLWNFSQQARSSWNFQDSTFIPQNKLVFGLFILTFYLIHCKKSSVCLSLYFSYFSIFFLIIFWTQRVALFLLLLSMEIQFQKTWVKILILLTS